MIVFFSHSRQNAGAALKLCDKLEELALRSQSGLKVWLDVRELDAGADWRQRVIAAIRSAEGFVVFVGPAPDEGQRFEWQQITDGEYYLDPLKPLIPVVIGSVEIPGFLRTRQTIQLNESAIDFDALAAHVAQSLVKPGETVDPDKMERGRAARQQALDSLKEYSMDLERDDVKRAGLRALK